MRRESIFGRNIEPVNLPPWPKLVKDTKTNKERLLMRQRIQLQNNQCAICEREFNLERRPHRDHDHVTGQQRGLLCSGCNTRLGFIEGPWHDKALGYINKWKKNSDQ